MLLLPLLLIPFASPHYLPMSPTDPDHRRVGCTIEAVDKLPMPPHHPCAQLKLSFNTCDIVIRFGQHPITIKVNRIDLE